jgi:hypothetical protein
MNRPVYPGAAPASWRPAPRGSAGRTLRHRLWQLLLLLCGAAAVAVFALTLMLPGMYSPHRLNAKQVPQVMLVPSSRAHKADPGVVWCQTRQAVFIC